jgi:matrixin
VKVRVAGLLAGLAYFAVGVAAAGDAPGFKILKLEGNAVHWQGTVGAQGRVITYAVVTEDMAFEGARNCRKMTRLDHLLSASQISPEKARTEIEAAFAMWQAVANIRFHEAPDPKHADILIGAQLEPVGWAFADVFYDVASRDPVKPISRSLICLNPERTWKVGFDGNLQRYDIRYTITHEIGHAIGLDHPAGAGEIMGYRYEEAFRDLQPGDIAGAVQLYGQRGPDTVAVHSEPPAATKRVRRLSPVRLYAKRWGTRAFTAHSGSASLRQP